MSRTPAPRETVVLLAGSALLALWAFARLPRPSELFRPPATPFDRTQGRAASAPAFLFLSDAAKAVPRGATAAILAEPRDAARETTLHAQAVALLPGRRVLPAAQWSAFTPEYEAQAEYLLILGPPPAVSPGELLLAGSGGTVWKRASR
ncbi:MAG: hypothetical protein M3R62_10710 [Acidobacteriota bacterium]|nr:hypothetical protein [Acidobacteriota bacterium]MDQ2979680.1 hypothetical protein [Acidobacteriota bacterium]